MSCRENKEMRFEKKSTNFLVLWWGQFYPWCFKIETRQQTKILDEKQNGVCITFNNVLSIETLWGPQTIETFLMKHVHELAKIAI